MAAVRELHLAHAVSDSDITTVCNKVEACKSMKSHIFTALLLLGKHYGYTDYLYPVSRAFFVVMGMVSQGYVHSN